MEMRVRAILGAIFLAIISTKGIAAQVAEALPSPLPDERLRADILVIVAHPDDEILVTGYLARAIYAEHKRVAVIFATRGDHGANLVGYEQGASLALMREMEARSALASLGVYSVWFLDAPNVAEPTEDPLGSLEKWSHGSVLEKTVRLIRLTRPQVIITWLPDYVVGENHSDHEAAGVLATEAFDQAGDALAYPEQVAPPLDYRGYGNLKEGLHPWQVEKLYYFSDAAHSDFLQGAGPTYFTSETAPARATPYYRVVAEEMGYYLTQSEGSLAQEALAKRDLHLYEQPVQLMFGKSLVKSSVTGDVFEGVVPGPIPFASIPGYQRELHEGTSLELGSPWDFYGRFWQAHGLGHLAQRHPPEIGMKSGPTSNVPLLLRNDTDQLQEIVLAAALPAGWKETKGSGRYPVRAHSVYPVTTEFVAPPTSTPQWQILTWIAEVNGAKVGSVSLRVFSAPAGSFFRPVGIPGP